MYFIIKSSFWYKFIVFKGWFSKAYGFGYGRSLDRGALVGVVLRGYNFFIVCIVRWFFNFD